MHYTEVIFSTQVVEINTFFERDDFIIMQESETATDYYRRCALQLFLNRLNTLQFAVK